MTEIRLGMTRRVIDERKVEGSREPEPVFAPQPALFINVTAPFGHGTLCHFLTAQDIDSMIETLTEFKKALA